MEHPDGAARGRAPAPQDSHQRREARVRQQEDGELRYGCARLCIAADLGAEHIGYDVWMLLHFLFRSSALAWLTPCLQRAPFRSFRDEQRPASDKRTLFSTASMSEPACSSPPPLFTCFRRPLCP